MHKHTKMITVDTQKIIYWYQKLLKIDVSRFFNGIDTINIVRDKTTGLIHYSPASTAGDGSFYKDLERFPWYYMVNKWEYEVVQNEIGNNKKVIEIGSGEGFFLEKIKDKQEKTIGLELNKSAIDKAKKKNLNVILSSIEAYADNADNKNYYDVICSFQVLEHVANVTSFINASVAVLKSGGKMIVAVPNNNSFIKYAPFNVLNIPPHHMNLWTEDSLTALTKTFPLTLKKFYFETLNQYHYRFYFKCEVNRLFPWLTKILFSPMVHQRFVDLLYFISWPINQMYMRSKSKEIRGHTIIAVFEKK